MKPFVLQSSSQFRTAGPPALSSATWAQDFNEVKLIGSATSAVRTPTQTYIARWWQSNPVASWNDVARQGVGGYGLGLADTARLLAMENLSGADAAINCWNDTSSGTSGGHGMRSRERPRTATPRPLRTRRGRR